MKIPEITDEKIWQANGLIEFQCLQDSQRDFSCSVECVRRSAGQVSLVNKRFLDSESSSGWDFQLYSSFVLANFAPERNSKRWPSDLVSASCASILWLGLRAASSGSAVASSRSEGLQQFWPILKSEESSGVRRNVFSIILGRLVVNSIAKSHGKFCAQTGGLRKSNEV